MTDTFHAQFANAKKAEAFVLGCFRSAGWVAQPWGMEHYERATRDALLDMEGNHVADELRLAGDILALSPSHGVARFVEVKTVNPERRGTRFAVARDSLLAGVVGLVKPRVASLFVFVPPDPKRAGQCRCCLAGLVGDYYVWPGGVSPFDDPAVVSPVRPPAGPGRDPFVLLDAARMPRLSDWLADPHGCGVGQ